MEEIVYFELNNWCSGSYYPDEEPFLSWFNDDLNLQFENKKWVEQNELCVRAYMIDMSANFLITAKKSWVEKNCSALLTVYKNFLRFPDKYGEITGRCGVNFLDYEPENIGISYLKTDF